MNRYDKLKMGLIALLFLTCLFNVVLNDKLNRRVYELQNQITENNNKIIELEGNIKNIEL